MLFIVRRRVKVWPCIWEEKSHGSSTLWPVKQQGLCSVWAFPNLLKWRHSSSVFHACVKKFHPIRQTVFFFFLLGLLFFWSPFAPHMSLDIDKHVQWEPTMADLCWDSVGLMAYMWWPPKSHKSNRVKLAEITHFLPLGQWVSAFPKLWGRNLQIQEDGWGLARKGN